ncbi:transposase [Candidatus Woesearchaeota archaeon]|nr:transposase [Candidatus Woesearchaeota archaeon]
MGKPNIRLNPQIDSIRNRVLLQKGTEILLSIALLLPQPTKKVGKGRRPYDYRIVLVLCILRILLRKKYADYEAEMRFDKRLMEMLKIDKLPCKSTINNYALMFTLSFLSNFNKKLIEAWIKKPVDLLLDSSGIRLVGRSIWFCIKSKKKILKKDFDKIHIAVSLCSLLIANFKISNSKRNDSPFLKKLLKPFRVLGLVIADKGYSGKKNAEYVANKKGAFFSPFKKNVNPTGFSIWNKLYKLWKNLSFICEGIYHQRSKVEAVFSALNSRYGDQLYAIKWYMRRREMAMRFIAYNVRIIIGIQIAREKNIPLWVRA